LPDTLTLTWDQDDIGAGSAQICLRADPHKFDLEMQAVAFTWVKEWLA